MADLVLSMAEMVINDKFKVSFSNNQTIDSPLRNVWRMACDRAVGKRTTQHHLALHKASHALFPFSLPTAAPSFPGDIKMVCDLEVEDLYNRADLMSRLRDLALNRLFFPPPNVFMTAANLITHFDQTIELVSKRIFQEPFREDEIEMQKVMPVLQKKEVGQSN